MHRVNLPGEGVVIANAVTAMTGFPVAGAIGSVAAWDGQATNGGAVGEFDLMIWAAAAVDLTVAHLYGAVLKPFVYADDTFTAANASEIFTNATHGLLTGDGPFQLTTSGALPAGLSLATDYWVIYINANTFYLATSLANALAGTYVSITTDGTGVQTISDTASTKRVHWADYGLLGVAGDGAISLGAQASYVVRAQHHPNTIAYAVLATLSGAVATSAAVYPIVER